MLRALIAVIAFVLLTLLLVIVLLVLRLLRLPGGGAVSLVYSRTICALLRVRITVRGGLPGTMPVLICANHVSWLDILVISAAAPTIFVAKSEVARWPLIGAVAKARGTVFVDRQRRHRTGEANARIAAHLGDGAAIVLFAEGTSTDGNRVLPFRPALLGALRDAGLEMVRVQPLSVAYTHLHGLPMGRRYRPLAAWYGDMALAPHIAALMRSGPVDVTLTFGEARPFPPDTDRKALARILERAVRAMTSAAILGRQTSIISNG